jgi:hypothetical protein
MNLSTGELALVLAGCVLVIGAIVVLWRRGVFGPKAADAGTHAGDAAK